MMEKAKIFDNPFGIIFNIVFVIYAWIYELLFKKMIFSYSQEALFNFNAQHSNIAVGLILLVALIAETVAIFFRSRHIRFVLSSNEGRVFKTPLAGYFAPLIFMCIFHLVGAGLVCVLMLSAFGIAWDSTIGMGILFILFLRELFTGYLIILAPSDRSPKHKDLSIIKRIISGLLLIFWGCIGYTIVWENLGKAIQGYFTRPDLFKDMGAIIQFVFVLIGVIIACFILFIPTRLGFYAEEIVLTRNKREKQILIISLIIAVICALVPFLGLF